ncbi:MAG: shikimate kinase [Gemmatimonadaceae bacterium]
MMDTFRTSKTVSALDPDKPHVVLVGLPGSGKSTVGALLGERMARTFLDFDLEIERREGMPVTQVFGERGEAGFRQLERKLTEELRDIGNMVVAPGGGWIMDQEGVALVRPPAVLIYLRVRPETALKRLADAVGGRPLLNRPNPLAELQTIFEARRALYQAADHEIGTELLTAQQVTDQIAEKLGVA